MAVRDSAQIPADRLGIIRRQADELTQQPYADETIRQIWQRNGQSDERTIAALWDEKAARQAALVDVTEGSSSRKMSQARTASLAMANLWHARADALVQAETPTTPPGRRSTTRAIRRV